LEAIDVEAAAARAAGIDAPMGASHQRPALPVLFPRTAGGAPRLFGMVHAAQCDLAHPIGVVLCNPLGYEELTVHRTYRLLAERLAAAGLAALRFDHDSTGNSAGRPSDPGRLQAWLDGIGAAIDALRARAPHVERVALFGVRFGATLAALAARERRDVDSLVLWAPIVSGRMHARELRVFGAAKASKVAPPQGLDGGADVGGFFFARETLADLSAIDLASSHAPAPGAARMLVLPRTERGAEEARWVEQLRARGMDVELGADGGYGAMMRDDPYFSVVPFAALDAIVTWLGKGRRLESPATSADEAAAASGREPAPALAVPELDGNGTLRETPLRYGDRQRLFGIVTEPSEASPTRAPLRPAVLLLNAGADHHVGPHRMNVDLARELASLGYLTCRFDAAGLGDSMVPPGVPENRIYTKDAVADVQRTMDLLGGLHGARRFVLLGLCSGAYLAFHAAAADARVAGQVLVSSYAFEWKEGDQVAWANRRTSLRSYLRAMLDRRVWLRAARGEIDVRGVAGNVGDLLRVKAEALPFAFGWRGPRNAVERAFVAMSRRGVESLLVQSNDGGLDVIERYLGTDAVRMRGRRGFALQMAVDADHTFSSLASQRTLYDLVARYLRTRFP
jgi:alpha-beta hydrolase superfamily lysophospholipase